MTVRSNDPRALIRYALIGAALTVLLVWMLFQVRGALLLIYVAALVAIGLSPVVASIERRRVAARHQIPRWSAILILYIFILSVLVGIGLLVVPPLVDQAREFWNAVPELLHKGQQWLIDRGLLSRELTVLEAVQKTPVARPDTVGTVLSALAGFVGGVFGVVTILILAFYFLVDAQSLVKSFVRLFPRSERARVNDCCIRVTTKVSAWLGGQLLLGGIIGTTAAIGLWLMGVPYFYVLALIAGVGELIPVVGPLLSAIPAVLVALSVSPALALGVTVFYIVQQQFENHVLVPRVMSRQVGVSAPFVIVSLLVGGSLLGIVGAILAVPTAAILQVLLEELVQEASSS